MNLIEEWRTKTTKDTAGFKKLIMKTSKSKNKSVNKIADDIHEGVFEDLDCLDCANCCKSIPPILNDMDIKRAAKYLGLKTSEFKDKYVRMDEDLDMVINSTPCPFLQEDNKCLIYEGRPRACREYPHTDNFEFQKNTKLHLKNSEYCPAVFHILKRMMKEL